MRGAQLRLTIVLLLSGTGCSLILNWSPSGQPCDVNNHEACSVGYSCAIQGNKPVCVTDHSLATGAGCQLDQQCPAGEICPFCPLPSCPLGQWQKCAPSCAPADAYSSGSACQYGQYCRPFYSVGNFNDSSAHDPVLVAACLPSDNCTAGSTCNSDIITGGGGACIPSSAATTACVVGCEISFSSGGGSQYGDNCGGVAGTSFYCQPLGSGANNDYLTCINTLAEPQVTDAPCNAFTQPCGDGDFCWNGTCRTVCQTTSGTSCSSPTDAKCCAIALNAATSDIGYCAPSCN